VRGAGDESSASCIDLIAVTGPVLPQRPEAKAVTRTSAGGAVSGKSGAEGAAKGSGTSGGSGDEERTGGAQNEGAFDLDTYGPDKVGDEWQVPRAALEDCKDKIKAAMGGNLLRGDGRIQGVHSAEDVAIDSADTVDAGGDLEPSIEGTRAFLFEHLPRFVT